MKKESVTIPYDAERLHAIRLYIGQQSGSTIEIELVKALDSLYGKCVPLGVRRFLEMKSSENSTEMKNQP